MTRILTKSSIKSFCNQIDFHQQQGSHVRFSFQQQFNAFTRQLLRTMWPWLPTKMARDGDLPTIFHPRRVRAPSVIITSEEVDCERGDDGDRERPNGPPTPLSPRAPLTPQTSVSSAPPLTTQPSLQQAYSESATSSQDEERQQRDKRCPRSCCSKMAKKVRISFSYWLRFYLEIPSDQHWQPCF